MFFLKKFKNKKKFKIKKNKGYLLKNLKKKKILNLTSKKKYIFKINNLSFLNNKKFNFKFNSYKFFNYFYKRLSNKKIFLFDNLFFFLNATIKKNNIFLNISNFNKKIIYSSSSRNFKAFPKKKEYFKKRNISNFFLNTLRVFFKYFLLNRMINNLPNFYILSNKEQSLIVDLMYKLPFRITYFIVNLFVDLKLNKDKKYLIFIKKIIKYLKRRKKIKFLSLNLKYKNSFNGCRLKKLKRL